MVALCEIKLIFQNHLLLAKIKNKTKKKQLAKLAANLVDDNDIIYIDSGTTTMHMIPYLAEKKNLTILTANVYVINEAFHYPQMNIIATGGTLYRPSNCLCWRVFFPIFRRI